MTRVLVTRNSPIAAATGGSLADGDELVLNGSFTAKGSGTPLVYDEFEHGAIGDEINNNVATIGSWLSRTGGAPGSQGFVLRSNARSVKGSRCAASNHTDAFSGNGSIYRDVQGGSETFYFDYYSYTEPVAGRSRNHKAWRLYGVGTDGLDNNLEAGNEVWRGAVGAGEHGPDPPWHYVSDIDIGPAVDYDLPYNQWVHFEVEFKATASNSIYRNWHDHILICEASKLGSAVTGGARVGVRLQNYWALDAGDGYPSNPGCVSYTDVAFVDNTLQRVVICNAATFAAASRRAIQPSTSWSTSQIRARVNTAGLQAGDTHYAIVLGPQGSGAAAEHVELVTLDI